MQRLGGQSAIDLSGDLTDPCGWREVPSQGEGAQGGQERLEGEDEGRGQVLLYPWAEFRSMETIEEDYAREWPNRMSD